MRTDYDITIKPISFSYVVVWKKPLTNIPPLAADFCKNLFGAPNETEYGFNQEGLAITIKGQNQNIPNQNPANTISIAIAIPKADVRLGYQRFSIFHGDQNIFLDAYTKLIGELKARHSAFYSNLTSRQIGVNIEYEVIFKSKADFDKWVAEKYFTEKLKHSFTGLNFQQLTFQLNEEARGKFVLVNLSPRIGNVDTLHCLINDHFSISPTEMIFEPNQLKKAIDDTLHKGQIKIIPELISNYA